MATFRAQDNKISLSINGSELELTGNIEIFDPLRDLELTHMLDKEHPFKRASDPIQTEFMLQVEVPRRHAEQFQNELTKSSFEKGFKLKFGNICLENCHYEYFNQNMEPDSKNFYFDIRGVSSTVEHRAYAITEIVIEGKVYGLKYEGHTDLHCIHGFKLAPWMISKSYFDAFHPKEQRTVRYHFKDFKYNSDVLEFVCLGNEVVKTTPIEEFLCL